MAPKQELIDWRTQEIAKILLRKSSFILNIEPFPTTLFDFFINQLSKPKYRFAVEVKNSKYFSKKINPQLSALIKARSMGMVNVPALIMKVDDSSERGEVDFLVLPSTSGKLLIKKKFDFKPITGTQIDSMIERINNWWDQG